MTDILIWMEMPRNCFECPLFTNCDACEGHECGCGLLGGIGYEEDISEDRRRDDCLLVKLPEHGDLIDRDAFRAENEYYLNREFINPKYEDTLDDLLKDAPVVIPSNKEETE